MAKKNKKGNNAKKAAPQHKAVDTVEQVPKPSSPEAHLHSLPETPTEETGPVCSLVHPEVSETSASAESGVLTARDVSDIGASDTGHMQDVDLNEQCTDQAAPSLEVDAVQEESDGMHGEDSGGDNQLGYLAQSDEPAAIQDDEPPAPPSPGNHPYAETAFEQSDVQESQLGTPDPTQDASDAPRKSLNDGLLEQRQSAANRDDAGDIAAAGMEQLDLRSASPIPDHLSRSPPSVPPPRGTSGHNNPSLRSPSKSPTLVAIANEAGPSRLSPHQLSSKPASPRPDLNPRSPIKSPRPASTLYIKPTIPVSTPVALTDEDDMPVDDSAPFESIPLQTTPPPHQSVTLPSSPRLHPGSPSTNNKRSSWSGFGVGTGKAERPDFGDGHRGQSEAVDPQSRSSISTLPTSQAQSDRATPTITLPSEKPEAPRLQAPPAHPHPFPIPSPNSPPPTHESKPSHTPSVPSGALGAKGVSTFEKVISHTRPSWLPPKDRAEDETHYHQWEAMMSQARELEKEKRKVEEAKRIEREKRLAINTPKWEEMLDEKTFSADKIRKDPTLRQIWFEGAPTYLRGKAWSLAIGNPLALSKDLYKSCLARSKKAIASGRFPPEILERIETDLDTTLVNLRLFQHGSPLRADLHELICTWVVYRSDTAMGYAPYINLLAALCLLSSPPATAFLSLVNLLSRPVLRAFYTETQDEIEAFYRVFENLQADMFPKIFANCKNLGLRVPESWFRSLLVEQVPFETACRLWDQIVLDGDGYIFRSALAIFGFLEPRLYFPDRDEIESVLEGRNHATQAIIERERERAKLRGETYQEELDGKLSVFGLNEQALFDWLASDGWREARFERLVTREMPD